MSVLMIIFCLIFSSLQITKEHEILIVENEIYELYSNEFYGFLTTNNNYNVSIDLGKLNEYFKDKSIDVIAEENKGEIILKIKYKFFTEREKVYSFYIGINNENK